MNAEQQNALQETFLRRKAKDASVAMNSAFLVGAVLGIIVTIALIYTAWV